jgi:hypothetical protein
MNVIAQTKDGFLVDMTKNEIASIQGLSWVDKRWKFPQAGDSIEISEVYDIVSDSFTKHEINQIKSQLDTLTKFYNWITAVHEKLADKKESLEYQPRN